MKDKKRTRIGLKKLFPMVVVSMLLYSCHLSYESDTLDLTYYQWNQWIDSEADNKQVLSDSTSFDISTFNSNPPSCGWEVLHRGNGKLVRIPAAIEDYIGVSWYHCRFTLPELWDNRQIEFMFDAGGPNIEVYLNEKLVGIHRDIGSPFEIDVTEKIYYTLDNHLAIRISDPDGVGGIGSLVVKSSESLEP